MNSYVFWIQSNRGTEQIQPARLPRDLDKSGIEAELEHWCSRFGAWSHSDNVVAYGWVNDGSGVRKRIQRYYKAKAQRGKQVDLLIAKKITTQQFTQWLRKHKKALTFPFK